MRLILSFLMLLLMGATLQTGDEDGRGFRINLDYKSQKIHVNSSGYTFSFDKTSTITDYELVFGQATRHSERGTIIYHFKYGKGILLIGKVNSEDISEFRVSFQNGALGSFKGAIFLNGKRIKPLYKIEYIQELAPNIQFSNWTSRWFFANNGDYNLKISYSKAGLNQRIESIKVFFEK